MAGWLMEINDLMRRLVVAVESMANRKPPTIRKVVGPFETREELCENVMQLHKLGWTGKDIAKKYGIHNSTVSRIIHGDKRQDNG